MAVNKHDITPDLREQASRETAEQALLVDSLRAELDAALRREQAARHDALRATDRAIGAEASMASYQASSERVGAELSRVRAALKTTRKERDRARQRIESLTSSTSWKVGSAIVTPTVRLRRRLRRVAAARQRSTGTGTGE